MRQPEPDRRFAGPLASLLLAVLLILPGAATADTLVHIHAVTRDGGAELTEGVTFEVWSRDGKRALSKVAERTGAPAEFTLAPDEYRVVTTYRGARSVNDFEVSGGAAVTKTVNLRLGRLKLELLPGPGAEPVRRDVAWTVHPYRGGAGDEPVARTQDAVPVLGLSAGWYRVSAHHRQATYTHVVEVAAGRSVTYSLFLK